MRWQQFWRSREVFWARAEDHKRQNGQYPAWVFDFISVHDNGASEGYGYRLLAPLCLVNRNPRSERMRWERESFPTLGRAIAVARRLAGLYSRIGLKIHVVNCPAFNQVAE